MKLLKSTFLVSIMAISACSTASENIVSAEAKTLKKYSFTDQSYNVWDTSCRTNSHVRLDRRYQTSKNTFEFILHKGQIGGCPTDKKPTLEGDAQFSERAEVNTDNVRLPNGRYIWSATIDIDRPCKPAKRNDIFQIHDGGGEGGPPSQLGIEHWNTFKTNQHYNTGKKVPNRPFNVIADIVIESKSVKVTYFIDGEEWKTTWAKRENTGKVMVKFGSYRINSNCTIKSKYTNVNFMRVK